MSKDKRVDGIYKILPLYEDMMAGNTELAEQCYSAYLSRVYIQYAGVGNAEICELLKGLIHLGKQAKPDDVRRVVFHMIGLVKKGGSMYGA